MSATLVFLVSINEFDEGRPNRNLDTIAQEAAYVQDTYVVDVTTVVSSDGSNVVFTVQGPEQNVAALRERVA